MLQFMNESHTTFDPQQSYVPNASSISHERLEDEVIIINLVSGSYFAGSNVTADAWTLVSNGASALEASAQLARIYSHDEKAIGQDVNAFVARLIELGLLEPATSQPTATQLSRAATSEWTTPILVEYTDMWDLIRLDPIHDVEETGWPNARPEH
ncbi:unannotated protein [freshwater metagenome]|uniref:Unannotated protein n=1 Tax=freshwater metagenome TaxID=449393 RepID=A0A6J5ZDV6_9ZZZZ